MGRKMYDLYHEVKTVGKLGRLQTLDVVPTVAGESYELNYDAIIRMAATRREVATELKVEFFVFHVKHRHAYGDELWQEYTKEGVDEASSLGSGVTIGAQYRDASYLALASCPSALPLWRVYGYNQIWNRYFRVQTTDGNGQDGDDWGGPWDTTAQQFFPTTETGADDYRKYGKLCGRLKHVLNGMSIVDQTSGAGWAWRDLTDADAQVAAGSTLDIRELAQIKARYKSEVGMAFFNNNYEDIMNYRWGVNINLDADKRPELCWHEPQWISGRDIDGTDAARHGSVVGKTLQRVGFSMPRKRFEEHGALWIMMLVRPPFMHADETHPLDFDVNPSGKDFLADPDIWEKEPHVQFDPRKWLNSTHDDGQSTARAPYGQHYRFHPNRTHPLFKQIPGYFLSKFTDNTLNKYFYHYNNEYDDCFQSWQMAHWQLYAAAEMVKFSDVPSAISSIYAGA